MYSLNTRLHPRSIGPATHPGLPGPYVSHIHRDPRAQQQGHCSQVKAPPDQSQLDSSSKPLKREEPEQFKKLAQEFVKLSTVDEIANWNRHLFQQFGNASRIKEYNKWSESYFKPNTGVGYDSWQWIQSHLDLKKWLRHAAWNGANLSLYLSLETLLHGSRAENRGLFSLGPYKKFWLILRLNFWAIYPQRNDPQLSKLYELDNTTAGGYFALRYKPTSDESTTDTLFVVPLGNILYTEAFDCDTIFAGDVAWAHEVAWKDSSYVLVMGIRDDGRTDVQEDDEAEPRFYIIQDPIYDPEVRQILSEDSDDDTQDDIFGCGESPYTLARLKTRPAQFLDGDISHVHLGKNIDIEPLSYSTPEVVETLLKQQENGEMIRFGLFPGYTDVS